MSQDSKRPDIDTYFINMVQLIATRGTCIRRKTGCILVNERNHVLATGYNGRESGAMECFNDPCEGADVTSGEDLDKCQAIHAEANALLQCTSVHEITTAYCTTSPCIHCVKLLMNTSCNRIVFLEEYPHPDSELLWTYSRKNWVNGRQWIKYELSGDFMAIGQR